MNNRYQKKFLNKRDKRYNTPIDNYTDKYKEGLIGGLIGALLLGCIYGLYKLAEWIFF